MGCILETKKHLDFKVYPNQFKSPRLSSSVYLNSALWKRNMDPVRENKKIARQLCHQLLQDHVRHNTHGQKNKRRSLQNCTGQIPISDKVVKRQLTWIGHMLRREKEEPMRICGLYEPKRELGTAKKGRPTESYASYIAGLISKVEKLSKEEIEAKAQQRKDWRNLVIACTGSYS